jgi:hypothetical protein
MYSARDSIRSGWHCDAIVDKLPVKTLAHEFGHSIHYILIKEYNEANPKDFEAMKKKVLGITSLSESKTYLNNYNKKIVTKLNKEIIQIAKEIDPNVDTAISRYGSSCPQEFFAECFANYECGRPNTLGKAMGIFLERNFK